MVCASLFDFYASVSVLAIIGVFLMLAWKTVRIAPRICMIASSYLVVWVGGLAGGILCMVATIAICAGRCQGRLAVRIPDDRETACSQCIQSSLREHDRIGSRCDHVQNRVPRSCPVNALDRDFQDFDVSVLRAHHIPAWQAGHSRVGGRHYIPLNGKLTEPRWGRAIDDWPMSGRLRRLAAPAASPGRLR